MQLASGFSVGFSKKAFSMSIGHGPLSGKVLSSFIAYSPFRRWANRDKHSEPQHRGLSLSLSDRRCRQPFFVPVVFKMLPEEILMPLLPIQVKQVKQVKQIAIRVMQRSEEE